MPLLLVRPSGVLRGHHRGRLRHIRSLSRGRHRPALSNRPAGPVSPDASSPTSTHPGGLARVADPRSALRVVARGHPRCHHLRLRARVELLLLQLAPPPPRSDGRTSDRGGRVHPPAPFVARGCSRAPGREPWRRVTRRRPVDGRLHRARVVTDARGCASPALRSTPRGAAPRTGHLHRPAGVRPARGPASASRCARPAPRVAPRRGEGRASSSSGPYGGRQRHERAGRGMGRFARLVLPGCRRRDRHDLGGSSSQGLPSSSVAASSRRRTLVVQAGRLPSRASWSAACPGVPPSPRHLAAAGLRLVPRAED